MISTSTGYIMSVTWDGLASKGQSYYSGAGWTGDSFLNAGSSTAQALYGKSSYYSHSLNTWLVPESVNNGFSMSAAMPALGGVDNNGASGWSCSAPASQPANSAWKLRTATVGDLGLPAMTGNQFACRSQSADRHPRPRVTR